LLKDFIRLVYPEYCAGCEVLLQITERGVCSNCFIDLKTYDNKKAYSSFGRYEVKQELYAFEFEKNGLFQKIIHQIKYNHNKIAAHVLGIELGKEIKRKGTILDVDVIIPVPISDKKRKKRGFNQCEYIANGVQQVINKPIKKNVLFRKNNLRTQIMSSRYERWENISNQYYVKQSIDPYMTVLLIDDIVTSGATVQSCIEAFKQESLNFVVAALGGRK
jgi:competence protein ComFC